MDKKCQSFLKKKEKGNYEKNQIDNEEDKDYSEFQNSAKKIITVLRLSIAKIKNDIQKGTLLLNKKDTKEEKNNNINERKGLNQSDNNSTSFSLSFNREINNNNDDIEIEKSENDLSSIYKNSLSFDFNDNIFNCSSMENNQIL